MFNFHCLLFSNAYNHQFPTLINFSAVTLEKTDRGFTVYKNNKKNNHTHIITAYKSKLCVYTC